MAEAVPADPGRTWGRGRLLVAGALMGTLLAATATGVVLAVREEQAGAEEDWQGHADRAARTTERELAGAARPLRELRGLMSRPLVERGEFQAIARVPVRGGLLAFATWSPRLTRAGRRDFFRDTGARLWSAGRAGRRAAPPRGVAYPVLYAEPPAAQGGPPLGLDLVASGPPARARARSVTTGVMIASGPAPLWPGGETGSVVVARVPLVRRGAPKGVVVGAIRGTDLAGAILRTLPGGSVVAVDVAGRRLAGPLDLDPGAGSASVRSLGQTWQVRVVGPERASWALPGLVLGTGLWLTLTIGLLLQDNAERARAERELRRRVDYDAALVSAIQDGLLVLAPDGRVTEASDRFLEMVGLPRDQVVGQRPPYPWWPAAEAEANAAWPAEMAERGGAERDLVFERPDGARLAVIATRAGMFEPDGSLAGYLSVVKDVTERRAAEAEQTALRRVAVDVAAGVPPQGVFERVAAEVAELLGAERGVVVRFGTEDPQVVGSAGHGPMPSAALEEAARGRAAVRDGEVAAPVRLEGRLWGAVASSGGREGRDELDATRLERLASLVAIALANATARAELVTQATTDPLTGLANRRAFQERLESEAERALRYGRALSLLAIDLDRFKRVNDTHGHPAGDAVLRELARRLRERRRAADMVARLGGEEFAWLMPETDAVTAMAVGERLRREVAISPVEGVGVVTVSIGVADISAAGAPNRLVDLADSALYRAKRRGRDRVALHLPPPAGDLLASADRGEPPAALRPALAAIARTADAVAAPGAGHSPRVAEVARLLAAELAWAAEDQERLAAAALAHDAGLIAVPAAVLSAPPGGDGRDRRVMEAHPLVSADLCTGVLDDGQVSWVRAHHERPDGEGYPDGLRGEEIPQGALLLAVAEMWATAAEGRPGAPARPAAQAVALCREMAGTGLWAPAVEALERLAARGALPLP